MERFEQSEHASADIVTKTVYFIRADDHVKVGFSQNVHKRLRQLQTGSCLPLRVEFHFHTLRWKENERALHAFLAPCHALGEWFYLPAVFAQYEDVCRMAGVEQDML